MVSYGVTLAPKLETKTWDAFFELSPEACGKCSKIHYPISSFRAPAGGRPSRFTALGKRVWANVCRYGKRIDAKIPRCVNPISSTRFFRSKKAPPINQVMKGKVK